MVVIWLGIVAGAAGLVLARFLVRLPNPPRVVADTTSETLGVTRIVASSLLLVNLVWEDLPSTALLPREAFQFEGVMYLVGAVPGFDALLASPSALAFLQVSTCGILCFAVVGQWTRLSVPLGASLYLIATGILRGYTHVFHPGLVACGLLFVLALGDGADGLSLDRARIGRAAGEARPSYAWTRFACLTFVGLSYAAAAFSKLREGGLAWCAPENIERIFYRSALDPMEFHSTLALELVDLPDICFVAFGIATLVFEALGISLLVSRTSARWYPWLATGFHTGVLAIMNILFWDVLLLPALLYRPRIKPRAASATTKRPRRLAAVLVGGLIVVGVTGAEFYPLTGWQMYSGSERTGAVEYWRVIETDPSGRHRRCELGNYIPALADTRYRDWFERFLPDRPDLIDRMLAAAVAHADHPIRSITIERRRFRFRDAPYDHEGELVFRHIYRP